MRFLLGESISPQVAPDLSAAGHDVSHVHDLGLTGASDPAVLDAAESDPVDGDRCLEARWIEDVTVRPVTAIALAAAVRGVVRPTRCDAVDGDVPEPALVRVGRLTGARDGNTPDADVAGVAVSATRMSLENQQLLNAVA